MNQPTQNQHTVDELDLVRETELFRKLSDSVLAEAKKRGMDQTEVGISKDLGLSVQVRNGDVDTLEFNRDNSFAITVYQNNRKGVVSSSDLSEKAVLEALDAAINIAKYTQTDPCAGLADAELMATNPVQLALDWPAGYTAEQAQAIALECESAGLAANKLISKSEGANFSSHRNIRCYANSHGFFAAVPSTRHSLSCVLIAEDQQGMQRDYWFDVARDANDLQSAKQIGEIAAEKTVNRLGGKRVNTQKCPVLFVPELARGLVGSYVSAIKGTNLYRKSSFLRDKLGQKIFPDFVEIDEFPFMQKGLASSWFDSEGVATREQKLVKAGEIQTYLLGSYSARKLNMQPTGHAGGTHNLVVESSGENFEQLVKKMSRGLIVTDLMGHGVNIVTGDFSRGAAGFWVENGEIQHFVQEITIASQLPTMYANLVAIGNDVDRRGGVHTGSWLIEEMTLAGA